MIITQRETLSPTPKMGKWKFTTLKGKSLILTLLRSLPRKRRAPPRANLLQRGKTLERLLIRMLLLRPRKVLNSGTPKRMNILTKIPLNPHTAGIIILKGLLINNLKAPEDKEDTALLLTNTSLSWFIFIPVLLLLKTVF